MAMSRRQAMTNLITSLESILELKPCREKGCYPGRLATIIYCLPKEHNGKLLKRYKVDLQDAVNKAVDSECKCGGKGWVPVWDLPEKTKSVAKQWIDTLKRCRKDRDDQVERIRAFQDFVKGGGKAALSENNLLQLLPDGFAKNLRKLEGINKNLLSLRPLRKVTRISVDNVYAQHAECCHEEVPRSRRRPRYRNDTHLPKYLHDAPRSKAAEKIGSEL